MREGLFVNFTTGDDTHVTLIDVENVVIDGLQPTFMFGDDNDNALTSAGARTDGLDGESGTSARSADLIDGRGGNDVLRGGDGEDVLIGGLGIDSLYGGRDDDGGILIEKDEIRCLAIVYFAFQLNSQKSQYFNFLFNRFLLKIYNIYLPFFFFSCCSFFFLDLK